MTLQDVLQLNAIGTKIFVALHAGYLLCRFQICLADYSFALGAIHLTTDLAAEDFLTFKARPLAGGAEKFIAFLAFKQTIRAMLASFALTTGCKAI